MGLNGVGGILDLIIEGSQCDAGFQIGRIEFQCGLKGGGSFLRLSFLLMRISQIQVSLGKRGIGLYRFLQVLDGLVPAPLLGMDQAK